MKRRSLLGFGLSLIGSASVLIVWALPTASQELTDSELGTLKQQIVKRVRETEEKNYRARNTSEVDRKSFIEYRNFWRKQDSKLSDLLGEWGGAWGYSVTIFPSKKPNQVCIQYVDESEVTVEAAIFKSGKIYWNSPSSKISAVLLRESNSLVFITKNKGNINILPQPISALPRLSFYRPGNSSPYSNLGCIVETSVFTLQQVRLTQSAINQSSSKPNTQTPNTLTWQQHIDSKASGGGSFSPYIQVDYDLPQEFRNGYIYRIEGVNTLWLYILKQGLPKYPSVLSKKSEQIDQKIADQYIREGKAILLQHSFSGSDERYSNRNVKFPKSGVGCLKRVCLTATFMTNTQIGNILLSQRAIESSTPNRSPSTAQQYKEQGDSKSRNGDKRGAISDYTSAIRLNSSFAVAYYNRAIDRVSVGDWQGALVDFRKAAELFKQQGKGRDQRDALSEIAKLQGGEKTASANCPTGQIPVVIKTADGQSPSYAGAANAGRTKNGKRTDGSKITPDARCISLVNIQSPSNPEETWLISHGWDDSSEGSLKNLAQEIAKRKPQDRVLILDWSEASNNKGDDGASPIGLSEKLSRGNYYAATWIRPVAEVVVQELKQKYNLDPASAANSLNLIGHSLGSLVSSEVGRIYKQNNGVGTSYLIALDPPSEFNVSTGSPIQDLGGYDLDGRTPAYKAVRKPSTTALAIKLTSPFETRTLVPGNVDRPQRFDSIARFSRAFVGKMSIAGNQAFAATAHESFQMDFGDRSDPRELLPTLSSLGREHGLVVESFTKRIAGEGLAPGFLGLNDRKQHSDIKRDAYPYNRKPFDPNSGDYQYAHEGVINISSSNEFSSFHLESPSVGKVVFSTPQNVENDTVYIQLDATTKGKRGRVAGGDLLPNVYQLFPSIAPINYMPLVR